MSTKSWAVLAGCALMLAASAASLAQTGSASKVKHVFVIVLENKNYNDTFRDSTQDPYLTGTLKPMGAHLSQYYGTGHVSLDNYISMISGQPSTGETQVDCPIFSDFVQTGTTPDGLPIGNGCVYPAHVKTLADQLSAARLTWKGYMEDMGNDPAREEASCGQPVIGAKDPTQSAQAPSPAVPAGDQYAARHNPFVYFHSIIDTPACHANVIPLTRLDADLASVATTPNFAFITPNLCNDAHDGSGTPAHGKACVNGLPGGLTSADAFLKTWVPKILASPAYKQDGLLIITFDEGNNTSVQRSTDPATGKTTVQLIFASEACCGQQVGPNVKRPMERIVPSSAKQEYHVILQNVGGERIGAVLISPFIKPGTVSDVPYNHYSLLKSLENIYGIGTYLGYANQPGLVAFGKDIFNNE